MSDTWAALCERLGPVAVAAFEASAAAAPLFTEEQHQALAEILRYPTGGTDRVA